MGDWRRKPSVRALGGIMIAGSHAIRRSRGVHLTRKARAAVVYAKTVREPSS